MGIWVNLTTTISLPASAPASPNASNVQASFCFNNCSLNGENIANDGICDDGGPNSNYAYCPYGNDCTDCLQRPRVPPPPWWNSSATPPPLPPYLPGEVLPARVACLDFCRFADDGTCDDGGPGSTFEDCKYGSDCKDCGERPPQRDVTAYIGQLDPEISRLFCTKEHITLYPPTDTRNPTFSPCETSSKQCSMASICVSDLSIEHKYERGSAVAFVFFVICAGAIGAIVLFGFVILPAQVHFDLYQSEAEFMQYGRVVRFLCFSWMVAGSMEFDDPNDPKKQMTRDEYMKQMKRREEPKLTTKSSGTYLLERLAPVVETVYQLLFCSRSKNSSIAPDTEAEYDKYQLHKGQAAYYYYTNWTAFGEAFFKADYKFMLARQEMKPMKVTTKIECFSQNRVPPPAPPVRGFSFNRLRGR